jgi:hypothetical protein
LGTVTPYTLRRLSPTDRVIVVPLLEREWGGVEVVALRFYRRTGFRLTALHPGAVDEARKTKPIPALGHDGIPIRDELDLTMELSQ